MSYSEVKLVELDGVDITNSVVDVVAVYSCQDGDSVTLTVQAHKVKLNGQPVIPSWFQKS